MKIADWTFTINGKQYLGNYYADDTGRIVDASIKAMSLTNELFSHLCEGGFSPFELKNELIRQVQEGCM